MRNLLRPFKKGEKPNSSMKIPLRIDEIRYTDGTVEKIVNGKVIKTIKPDKVKDKNLIMGKKSFKL